MALYWRTKGTPLEAEMRELFPARWAVLDCHNFAEDLSRFRLTFPPLWG